MPNDNKHLTLYLKSMSRTNFKDFVNQMFKLIEENSRYSAPAGIKFSFTGILS